MPSLQPVSPTPDRPMEHEARKRGPPNLSSDPLKVEKEQTCAAAHPQQVERSSRVTCSLRYPINAADGAVTHAPRGWLA